MSSIVCQGLPSGLSEFSHPISFQKPPEKDTHDLENSNGGGCDLGGWSSFILTLATNASSPEMTAVETEQVYIHRPQGLTSWKSSSSTLSLSTKSLEICTEGLGSESGSNIDELIDDLSCCNHSIEKQSTPPMLLQRSKKTNNRNVSLFPPPLTSISGSETTRVRPYRESGRLVLKATSFSNSSFQAERGDGRLRLYSILKDGYDSIDKDDDDDDDSISMGVDLDLDLDLDLSEEKEMEEFLRTSQSSSCKEAGPRKTGMPISWGPYWVAIS